MVVSPLIKQKYNININLELYGIAIEPKSPVYEQIPKEELLPSQAKVIFFIDTDLPGFPLPNFVKIMMDTYGKSLLQFEDATWDLYSPDKLLLKVHFNQRPLYPLDYKLENDNQIDQLNEGQYDFEDSEEYYEKIDNLLNKFLKTTGKEKDMPNFVGFKVISGKDRYGNFTIKLTGLFKKPFSGDDSDKIHQKSRKITKLIRETFPFLKTATFYGGGTSTIDNYEKNLDWEKSHLNRKTPNGDNLPFLQEEKNGIKTRLFKENTNSEELKWHFDERDRNVKVVKSNGWKVQFDNQLPITLKEGNSLFIPKGVYHRVIKGNGELIVKIKEL